MCNGSPGEMLATGIDPERLVRLRVHVTPGTGQQHRDDRVVGVLPPIAPQVEMGGRVTIAEGQHLGRVACLEPRRPVHERRDSHLRIRTDRIAGALVPVRVRQEGLVVPLHRGALAVTDGAQRMGEVTRPADPVAPPDVMAVLASNRPEVGATVTDNRLVDPLESDHPRIGTLDRAEVFPARRAPGLHGCREDDV